MNGIIKGLIAGIIIIVIGAAILITGLALNGWTFGQPDFEMKRFEAVGENSALKVDFGSGALRTEYYDGEKIAIDYPETSKFNTQITESDGILTFKARTKWFVINIGKWDIPDTVIYLPKNVAYDLDIDVGSGNVNIASGTYGSVKIEIGAGALNLNDCNCTDFDGEVDAGLLSVTALTCNTFNAEVSAGKFDVTALTCNAFNSKVSAGKLAVNSLVCPEIKTSVSAGTADVTVKGIESEYNITASVSAGSCNVTSRTGTTSKTINARCSAGTIKIYFNEG